AGRLAEHVNDLDAALIPDENGRDPLPDPKPDPLFKPHTGGNLYHLGIQTPPPALFPRPLPGPSGNREYLRFSLFASPPYEFQFPLVPDGEKPHRMAKEKAKLLFAASLKETFFFFEAFMKPEGHFAYSESNPGTHD